MSSHNALSSAPAVLLSGHTHQPYENRIGAARLLGAPSTFYGLRHAGHDWTVGFNLTGARIIDLHPDGTIGHAHPHLLSPT
jgi:hypothetical protein